MQSRHCSSKLGYRHLAVWIAQAKFMMTIAPVISTLVLATSAFAVTLQGHIAPLVAPLVAPLITYKGPPATLASGAWSPDGRRLALGSANEQVQVWSATSTSIGRPLVTYTGHQDVVASVAWSPDGKRLASASYDKTVQVWDATTGKPLVTYKGHKDVVASVAWSPDGKRLASASYDKTVQVWDATTGKPLLTYCAVPPKDARFLLEDARFFPSKNHSHSVFLKAEVKVYGLPTS